MAKEEKEKRELGKEEEKAPEQPKEKIAPKEEEKGEVLSKETVKKAAEETGEKVVRISRVSKVVKGGKNFSFSALVVAGDGNGQVGMGLGKSNEVVDAIRKGSAKAKINYIKVKMSGETIPHEVIGRFKASRVIMKPAGAGTGVIAGGPVRAICDAAGIRNILTKSLGSRNPVNVVKATLNGFKMLRLERVGQQITGDTNG